jgi:diguanylate cyclase (GGDEF)-like protein
LTQLSIINNPCLENSPCGTLILDQDGRITWLNSALEEMLGLNAQKLVGLDAETLPFTSHRGLFKGPGLMHLIGPEVTQERWLQCHVVPLEGADASAATAKYFLDVTERVLLQEENQRLHHQVEELAITDKLTGLANRLAFTRSLDTQVARSRRYQNPLSLTIIALTDDHHDDDQIPAEVIVAVSHYLRDRLRWVDLIARWEHNRFIIILPETNQQDGTTLLNKVVDSFSEIALPVDVNSAYLALHFGLAEWHKGQDGRLLLAQTEKALAEKSAQG